MDTVFFELGSRSLLKLPGLLLAECIIHAGHDQTWEAHLDVLLWGKWAAWGQMGEKVGGQMGPYIAEGCF